jgi:ATP-dependent helicase/nuclease subunit B
VSGWSILAAEEKITGQWNVTLSGLSLRGTIDRVDQNEDTGKLRIIDYKTSSSTPEKAHWTKAPAADHDDPEQAWKCFDPGDGKWKKWVNLQLPLYAEAATAPDSPWPRTESIEAAYLSLPAAVSEVKWQLWESLDDAALLAATQCAREAARRIQEGIFWPPSSKVPYDDFSGLFQGDPLETVAPPELWRDEETQTSSRGVEGVEVQR